MQRVSVAVSVDGIELVDVTTGTTVVVSDRVGMVKEAGVD